MAIDVRVTFLNGDTEVFKGCHSVNDVRVRLSQYYRVKLQPLLLPQEFFLIADETFIPTATVALPRALSIVICEHPERTTQLWVDAFISYAEFGDFESSTYCLDALVDRNPEFVDRSLRDCAAEGDHTLVKALLEFDPDLNATDVYGNTALHFVAGEGGIPLREVPNKCRRRVTELLVARKCAVNAQNHEGNTALHVAVMKGERDVVTVLVSQPDVMCSPNLSGFLPLHSAAQAGNEDIVRILSSRDVNAETIREKWTPLHFAVQVASEGVVSLLLSRKAAISVNGAGLSPLHLAAKVGNIAVTRLLLESSNVTVVNARTSHGLTPLHFATNYGKKDIVEAFLERQDVALVPPDLDGITPLQLARFNGHYELVTLIRQEQQRRTLTQDETFI